MPIRPIDLQAMLLQLSQVGREQSIGKEGAALQAAMKSGADQKRLDETKESVHRPEDEETASRAIGDRSGPGSGSGNPTEGEAEEGQAESPPPSTEVVKDPDLGKRVDLSG